MSIDPEDCGCTDCIVGDSVPLNAASNADKVLYLLGMVYNRTFLTDDELVARFSQDLSL